MQLNALFHAMKISRQTGAILLGLIITQLISCTRPGTEQTEIIWDNWGVPHVYATDEAEMYHAFGWAQMQSHANLVLKLYAEARGMAAEYFGEEFLESDRRVHLFNLPDSAEAHYQRTGNNEKMFLDAFVQGMNQYAKTHPDEIDERVKRVLPVQPTDVLAHVKRVMSLEFLAGNDIRNSIREIGPGSNSYAIAPSKSESGNAMLVANPHLPWSDFYLFFEAHLTSPGFNVYGVTLVGMPVLNIAFNEHLGWTHTVNTIDASDRYELTLQEGGYLLDGVTVPFQEKKISLQVLQADGNLEQREVTLNYSEHGPVIGKKGDKAYAIRIAGMEKMAYYTQYHRMGKATNLDEFEDALKMMQIPMFNLVYADRNGNILYLFNGNIPERQQGDWNFWNNTVDGTQSDYIWDSYHRYEELPRLLNPSTGFVQNANDPPWTSTYPILLEPGDFPPYFSPRDKPLSMRPQRAINLVKDDASISFEELVDYKLDTGMEAADRFLDDLLAAVEQYPNPTARSAASLLEQWDKGTNAGSRGAVLFSRWFDKLEYGMFVVPWSMDNPASTPAGLSNPKQAVELLAEAATEVEEEYGSLDIAWGEVNRFKVDDIEFPGNGGHDKYGVFRTMYFEPNEATGKNYAFHGDTFVAVVEFGENVRAEVLLSYGNATQPGSRHVGDQLRLLSENKLRPALLTKEEILKHGTERVKLN